MRSVALVVLAVTCATGARAQAPSRLSGCLTDVLAGARARGGRPTGDAWSGFLLEGENASFPVDLTETGCTVLVAVGEAKIRDVDLFLHTAGGTEIAHDTSEDAHPVVRFCGARGAHLFGTVRAYAGRGEVLVARIDHAPPSLDDLDARLGTCSAAAAGVHTTPPELGPAPPDLPVGEALSRATARLTALGFVADRDSVEVALPTRDSPIEVAPGCHAIVVASAELAPVLAQLRDAQGRVLVEDGAAEEPALLRTCATAVTHLWLRGDRADAHAAVAVLRAPAISQEPAGLVGGARVRYAETSARVAAHGLATQPLAWAFVSPGSAISLPWALHAGVCVALAAVPDDEVVDDDLDLVLSGADGRLLAWDVGLGSSPMLWHCPDRDETAHLVLRHYGGAPGEVLVVAGGPP